MPHCLKSHVAAHISLNQNNFGCKGVSILALLGVEWANSPSEKAPISLSFKLLAEIESGTGKLVNYFCQMFWIFSALHL